MDEGALDDEMLDRLKELSKTGEPTPWRSFVEGRDSVGGDTFIMIGTDADRREDLYLTRDSGPGDPALHDLIAEARTALPLLIHEIRRLRSELAAQ